MIQASDVSARIEALIARHHRGDRTAAAERIGIGPRRLAGLLSGDWRRFSLDALAALVVAYGVRLEWLLASSAARASSWHVHTGAAAGERAAEIAAIPVRLAPDWGARARARRRRNRDSRDPFATSGDETRVAQKEIA